MDIRRLITAVVLPPAAVLNKEIGTVVLTGFLTLTGWLPGVVAALFMIYQEERAAKA